MKEAPREKHEDLMYGIEYKLERGRKWLVWGEYYTDKDEAIDQATEWLNPKKLRVSVYKRTGVLE